MQTQKTDKNGAISRNKYGSGRGKTSIEVGDIKGNRGSILDGSKSSRTHILSPLRNKTHRSYFKKSKTKRQPKEGKYSIYICLME
jgi:hypothetical protein